jgi:glycosyltransferase involved in cell wall biosynthesis
MHIVFLTNEYPKKNYAHGGIGSFVQTLARACVLKRIKVSIVGLGYTDKTIIENDNGVIVYRIGRSKVKFGSFIFNSLAINKKIKSIHQLSPIHIVEGAELDFCFITKIKSIQYIIRLHGGHHFFSHTLGVPSKKWRAIKEKLSFKKADKFIAVTNFVGEKTKELLKLDFEFTCIYNFVDTDLFSFQLDVEKIAFKLIFVGTVCEKKGIRQLIMALPKIIENFPKVHLEVIGRDWFFANGDSYIENLKKSIEPKVFNHISFLGVLSIEEVANHLASAHIAVFPSHMESFGLTLIEAMSMKIPVLASDIPPFREIIGSNDNAILCNPYSVDDISNKLCAMLEDENQLSLQSVNACKRVENIFNKTNVVEQNINYYQSLIKK